MQGPDRRRGGSHVLRTGPPLGPRRGSVSDGHGPAHARPGAGAGPLALPPRAAVAGAAGPDESRGGDVDPGPAAPSAEPSDRDGDGDGDGNGRAAERAKDARIARLEADVAAMERDFRRERNRLSQAESETAVFWQARYSALNRQFLDADAALRVLRAEADRRSAEREDLLQSWELLHRRLRERDDEVRSLKDFVSTSTRSDGQTSDDFGDAMAKLANGLQNWVIVHFRKARLDLTATDETRAELAALVPACAELLPAAKIHVLQSVVSRILVDAVFGAYFVGLSDDTTRHFRQMEQLLCSLAASDEAVNQWRSSTLALLRRDALQLLDAETSAFVDAVVARISRILDALAAPPPSADQSAAAPPRPSEARDAALRLLVNGSVELARLLAVQRAVLRVHMPEVRPQAPVAFEPATMDDVGGLDDALTTRRVACVVFPGIIKRGDESGAQMQFRNVVAKARVLCSPGED